MPVVAIDDFAFYNVGVNRDDILGVIVPASIQSIGTQSFASITSTFITIEFEDDSQLKVIGERGFYNSVITSLTIPNGVEEIGDEAFRNCSNLSGEFLIPDSVQRIGEGCFDGCETLISIVLPESIQVIQADTFKNCTALKSIKLPDTIQLIAEGAFQGCVLNEIVFSGNDKYGYSNGVLYEEDGAVIASISQANVVIPESVTSIGDYAFVSMPLTSITFNDSIESIGRYAFA